MQATAMKLNQEAFVDRQDVRELYIGRVDVLNKVKTLVMLPDGEYTTTEKVAEFYNVDKETIKQVIKRNRPELDSDGYHVMKYAELNGYKEKYAKVQNVPIVATTQLAIIPRRAVLRIGMLLRDSEVAKQIRTYLLNIEETASHEHKNNALTYTGTWTKEQMELLLKTVVHVVDEENGTATQAFKEVAEAIGASTTTVSSKWQNTIRFHAPKHVLDKIRNNRRGSTLVLLNGGKDEKKTDILDSNLNLLAFAEQLEEMKQKIEQMQQQEDGKEINWAVERAELVAKLNAQEEIIAMKNQVIQSVQKEKDALDLVLAERNEKNKQLKVQNRSLQDTINILMARMNGGESNGISYKVGRNLEVESISGN